MQTPAELTETILKNPPKPTEQWMQPQEAYKPIALASQPEAQITLAKELHNRFHAMKTYGKEPESLVSITQIFLNDLAEFPPEKVMMAIKTHSQRSQEFPTVADLVGIIKRNGKPPLKESDVIAVRKKDGELRTPDDWQLLREWDHQQSDGWQTDYYDKVKEETKDAEITRLRKQVFELKQESDRAWEEVKKLRVSQGIEKPAPEVQDQIDRTVAMMREMGAPQNDIDEFLVLQGAA